MVNGKRQEWEDNLFMSMNFWRLAPASNKVWILGFCPWYNGPRKAGYRKHLWRRGGRSAQHPAPGGDQLSESGGTLSPSSAEGCRSWKGCSPHTFFFLNKVLEKYSFLNPSGNSDGCCSYFPKWTEAENIVAPESLIRLYKHWDTSSINQPSRWKTTSAGSKLRWL